MRIAIMCFIALHSSPLMHAMYDTSMVGSPAMYPETNSAANSPAFQCKKHETTSVQDSLHSSGNAHDDEDEDLLSFEFDDDNLPAARAPIPSVTRVHNASLESHSKNRSTRGSEVSAIARRLSNESMVASFGTMVAQQKRMEDPKVTAHRHLVKGVKYFLGTMDPCGAEEGDRYLLAYGHLIDAVRQPADPVVASWAQIWLFRLYRSKADEQSDEKAREEMKSKGLGFLLEVIKNKKDDETVVTANLLLSRAYALGDGAKRNLELASILADIVHKDRKHFPQHALRAHLHCAEGYIKACETSSNFQGIADAEEHLMHVPERCQFEDLRLQANTLHNRLQRMKQRREYCRGLAYLRQAPCDEDNNLAQQVWEALEQQGLHTLDAVREHSMADYAYLLMSAEHCFDGAAYDDYDPEIKAAARTHLAWIYKMTHRPNKFALS